MGSNQSQPLVNLQRPTRALARSLADMCTTPLYWGPTHDACHNIGWQYREPATSCSKGIKLNTKGYV